MTPPASAPAPIAPASSVLPLAAAISRTSPAGKFALIALGVAVVALSVRLWPQWRSNPDLSHGMFMPLLFLVLLHEARSATPRYLRSNGASRFGFGALLTLALLSLVAAGLYAASVDWSHPLVNLMLTLSLVFFLGTALMVFARDSIRLIACNWTAVVAVALWLLSAPIPPGTYTRLTIALQLAVSEAVLRALHVLGIAAVRHGNIIDLANTAVGVEEACSGVRSLISCIFAAGFFSATLVRRNGARVLILALAAPLALVMNFFRSLALTLLANRGIDISGQWHDATGYAVLGVTAAILGGVAVLLEHGSKPARRAPLNPPPAVARARGMQWILAAGLGVAAVLAGLFVANTRSSPRQSLAVPNVLGLLPETAPGWQVRTTNLYSFSGTLHTEHLAQRSYYRDTPAGPVEIIIYVAYWRPGQAPVSLVAAHTPDACWPGSGWEAVPTSNSRVDLMLDGRLIPPAEHRLFEADHQPQHVWFWHIYDGQPLTYRDPYSAIELLRMAWRYGFRRGGDQLFVRLSSNRPWADIADAPQLAEFFARTRALGL